jgi:hypothetical protein
MVVVDIFNGWATVSVCCNVEFRDGRIVGLILRDKHEAQSGI